MEIKPWMIAYANAFLTNSDRCAEESIKYFVENFGEDFFETKYECVIFRIGYEAGIKVGVELHNMLIS